MTRRLTWRERRWMRRVGWHLAATYEMVGLDFTWSATEAAQLRAQAVYWSPKPSGRHRHGWSVLYNRFGDVLGVWPSRPCTAIVASAVVS